MITPRGLLLIWDLSRLVWWKVVNRRIAKMVRHSNICCASPVVLWRFVLTLPQILCQTSFGDGFFSINPWRPGVPPLVLFHCTLLQESILWLSDVTGVSRDSEADAIYPFPHLSRFSALRANFIKPHQRLLIAQ